MSLTLYTIAKPHGSIWIHHVQISLSELYQVIKE